MQGFSGKPFPQRKFEIATLEHLMAAAGCRSYLEIGARYGDSFHFLAFQMGEGAKALAVDLPGSKAWGNAGSELFLEKARVDLCRRGIEAGIILGDSRDPDIIGSVQKHGPFDCVFIDGDHSFDGVKSDWENYGPIASKMVAFHDIDADMKPKKKAQRFGVPALWRTLKATHPHVEIIDREREMGIGVLFLER